MLLIVEPVIRELFANLLRDLAWPQPMGRMSNNPKKYKPKKWAFFLFIPSTKLLPTSICLVVSTT